MIPVHERIKAMHKHLEELRSAKGGAMRRGDFAARGEAQKLGKGQEVGERMQELRSGGGGTEGE